MNISSVVGYSIPGVGVGSALILVLILWELVWKGLALWKAAQKNAVGWYIALLILNTVGILPILYIYVFSKKESKRA